MTRYIGIRHRVKQTAEGEARPTMVAIREEGKFAVHKLETETEELDFLMGRFPTAYREAAEEEDLTGFLPHHVRRRRRRGEEEASVRVPVSFEGLQVGDIVAMSLGGSGDRLSFALSRRGEEIGAKMFRIPPFTLKDRRGNADKEEDHILLALLVESAPELLYEVGPRARDYIAMREAFRFYRDAQKDRIRCEQRLRQRVIGRIFLSAEGKYPEGMIEDIYDSQKASDVILQNLLHEEAERQAELFRNVRRLDVWREVLSGVVGMGERIAAGLLAPIGEVLRFQVKPDLEGAETPEETRHRKSRAIQRGAAKLKKYCGVHVLEDGSFPRKRRGQVANWTGEARQSLYLFAEQCNYHPDALWGQKLREYKAKLHAKHAREVMERDGKQVTRYSDAHIHKMGTWRTLTRFVEWLYPQWLKLEERSRGDGDGSTAK